VCQAMSATRVRTKDSKVVRGWTARREGESRSFRSFVSHVEHLTRVVNQMISTRLLPRRDQSLQQSNVMLTRTIDEQPRHLIAALSPFFSCRPANEEATPNNYLEHEGPSSRVH
jgi:hypothetical protein